MINTQYAKPDTSILELILSKMDEEKKYTVDVDFNQMLLIISVIDGNKGTVFIYDIVVDEFGDFHRKMKYMGHGYSGIDVYYFIEEGKISKKGLLLLAEEYMEASRGDI